MFREKIRGESKYCDDIEIADLHYGKTLRSAIAHGRIKSIVYPKLPEGYCVVDYRDIRGKNIVKIIELDQPVFAEKAVNYIGEPIAVIVGRDKNLLNELVEKTVVEYEVLKPVLTMDEALIKLGEGDSTFVFGDFLNERGDIEKAKNAAKYIFSQKVETGSQEHIYMETQSMVGDFDGREVNIIGSMQSLYAVKGAVEFCTGYPANVKASEIGGGFGGKEDFPSLIACHAALSAIKSGKPVKIVYERGEDIICTTKRHPSRSSYTLYVDENYKILGIEADLLTDAGAYTGLSNAVLELFLGRACGLYDVPSLKIRGRSLKTNKLSFGAWRGFGAPQGIFAIETVLDLFAKKHHIDPVEFKRKNLAKRGSPTTSGGKYREEIKLQEMLDELLAKSDYYSKVEKYKFFDGEYHRGIGISFSMLGGGLNGNVERDFQKAKIKLKRFPDGRVEILSTALEIGQGTTITQPKIVATVLRIPQEMVTLNTPDSKYNPDSGPVVASRNALIVGKIVERAAMKLKKILEERDSSEIIEVEESYLHPEGFSWNPEKHSGDLEISRSMAVNIVEVAIDSDTMRIYPVKYWGYYDIGTPLDLKVVMGQIQGGVLQGLSHSHMERLEFDNNGAVIQKNLTEYTIPTSRDTLPMEIYLADNPGEQGPLGAKSLGELPFIGMTSAFLAAVNSALNTQIDRVPLYPELLMEVKDELKI